MWSGCFFPVSSFKRQRLSHLVAHVENHHRPVTCSELDCFCLFNLEGSPYSLSLQRSNTLFRHRFDLWARYAPCLHGAIWLFRAGSHSLCYAALVWQTEGCSVWVGDWGGSYCLIYGIVLVLALFFMCSLFFFLFFMTRFILKSWAPDTQGPHEKAQGSLRRQTRRLLRECFFFLQSNESRDAERGTAS